MEVKWWIDWPGMVISMVTPTGGVVVFVAPSVVMEWWVV